MEKKTIIGLVVALLVCLSSLSLFMKSGTRPTPKPVQAVRITSAPPTAPPQTVPPTTAPPATTAPATATASPNGSMIIYGNTMTPPMIPPIYYPPVRVANPNFVLVPGANFPGIVGKPREFATSYIMTTYPRLVVRAIPYGSPVTYDVRKDRVTVMYDTFTNRVISARVG